MTTIRELFDRFQLHASTYYQRNPAELRHIQAARKATNDAMSLDSPVESFGPLALQNVRDRMIEANWCRTYINKQAGRLVKMFGWGVGREIVPVAVAQALEYVSPLRAGSSTAREGRGAVQDVPVDDVMKTLPFLASEELRDIVMVQMLSAARGGEILKMRPIDLTFHGDTADYVPKSHKTDYKGKSRTIVLGPRALEIVKRRMPLSVTDRIFPSFSPAAYNMAIKRAAERAGVQHFHAHQLRHSGCTTVASLYGIEAASHVAGHGGINTTELYAHNGVQDARRIMREIG